MSLHIGFIPRSEISPPLNDGMLGCDDLLLEIFYANLEEMGFEDAFVYTYGQSLMDFYAAFDEFLKLPLEEQLAPRHKHHAPCQRPLHALAEDRHLPHRHGPRQGP